MMTRLKFREWLHAAERNDRLVYYRGYLARDIGSEDKHQRTDDQHDIAMLGEAVNEAARKGLVLLFQKRNGETNFDYYAVRT